MKDETKTIIRYRLERSRESLKDAVSLFKEGSLHSAVNRIYYAMFYSVNALLLTKNLSSSRHSGVRALFHKEFVNKGEVDEVYGKFYSEIFEKRQVGDYRDLVEFEKEKVSGWLEKAEEFILAIDKVIEDLLNKESSSRE